MSSFALPDPLPEEAPALQALVGALCAQLQELEQRLAWFTEQYRLAQQRRFGATRETNPHQLDLFAELLAQAQAAVPTAAAPEPAAGNAQDGMPEAQAVRPCRRICRARRLCMIWRRRPKFVPVAVRAKR